MGRGSRVVAVVASLGGAALLSFGLAACGGDDTTPDCSSPGSMCGPVVIDGSADVTLDTGAETGGDTGADTSPADTGPVDSGHDASDAAHDAGSDAHDATDGKG